MCFRSEIVTKGLEFPLSFKEIGTLENLNTHISLSINVYDYNEDTNMIGVVRTAEKEKQNHVNLLLLYDKDYNGHYVYIKNLFRFVRPYLTTAEPSEYFLCTKCLTCFKSEREFELHEKIKCLGIRIRFPPSEEIRFQRQSTKEKHYMSFIADFETYNATIESNNNNNNHTTQRNTHSFNEKISKLEPLAAAYKIQSVIVDDDYLHDIRLFTGADCVEKFIQSIIKDAIYFFERYLKKIAARTPLTRAIEEKLDEIDTCYVCNKKLNFTPNNVLVIDHSHINCDNIWMQDIFPKCIPYTNIRTILHNNCNIQFKSRHEFYIVCHNFACFDSFFILNYLLTESVYKHNIKVVPRSNNNFISASFTHDHDGTKLKFIFIDSLNHLSGSLSNLTAQCPEALFETQKYLNNLVPYLNNNDKERFKKLPLCYDYLTSIEMCNEIRDFPEKDCFKNKLRPDMELSQEDYDFAKAIYDVHCSTLMDWVSIYLSMDVVLLYDLFLYYRRIILNYFNIDPIYYFSAPQLSYNIMLDRSKRNFKIMTDPNMLTLVIKNIRAGMAYGTANLTVANNEFCKTGYKPTNDYVTIIPMDVCSLYSYTLSEFPYPIDDFRFIYERSVLDELKTKIETGQISKYDTTGYLIVCKISVKQDAKLHRKLDSFPLFPTRVYFPKEKCYKLISNLDTKDNYLTHSLYVQLGVKLGYTLDKIYYAIAFRQEKFLSNYLHKLQELRENNRSTPFLNLLFKLLGNFKKSYTILKIRIFFKKI